MSLGQLVNSNAHTKWAGRPTPRTPHAARCTHAAIRSHPRSIPGHPGRLAASPSARALPPSRPVSPRGASHHPISPGQLVNSLRQHARNSPRAPDACLPGPRRERRPVGRPRPTGAPAPCGRPSCVQTFCGPKVIRGGRPPAHRVLATVSRGQLVNGPWTRTRARTASLP
ncbi:Myb-like DNA-binding domain family protein [Aspergillus tubingensis]|uniref:Myb-like DNA-binding domain family protein n=1 Tax=Aspergillus tubingensis TaxID=5068 RepID=UPI0015794A53|nr:Myb-like DNA-binding domain family protein [Aspergillus tubingensis]GFN21435.1 Myb-like DNA-binding domain family protein [Aspergillus tubingensis]